MVVWSGYDKRVIPTMYRVRPWTAKEVLNIDGCRDPLKFLANDGTMRDIRLNGAVKRWKTNPMRIEIPVKYGLRECARWSLEEACRRLVKITAVKEPGKPWLEVGK